MASVTDRNSPEIGAKRRFVNEATVEEVTGFSRRTLQKDRLFGRNRFPAYRVGSKILYDIEEVVAIIKGSRL